jgi:hypothetical protein
MLAKMIFLAMSSSCTYLSIRIVSVSALSLLGGALPRIASTLYLFVKQKKTSHFKSVFISIFH